jgi:hypothetical protein
MDAAPFDTLARRIGSRTSRRVAVGLVATSLFTIAIPDAVAARCTRQNPCPKCKSCRHHRCKPDTDVNFTPCGDAKACRDGACLTCILSGAPCDLQHPEECYDGACFSTGCR